jgi:hypothetical protein
MTISPHQQEDAMLCHERNIIFCKQFYQMYQTAELLTQLSIVCSLKCE